MMSLATLPDRLHKRILEKKRRFDTSHPLPKDIAKKIEERMRTEFVYNTNRIEGNTLTRGETELILRGMTVHGKNILDVIAVENHLHAIDFVKELATNVHRHICEDDIKEIHALVMEKIMPNAGQYRDHDISVRGAGFEPPLFYEVPKHMKELVEFIDKNTDELRPIELAAHAHYYLAWTHPFEDGNGRVARLLLNFILLRNGYPLTPIKNVERKKYLDVLKRADQGDFEPYVNYIARCVEQMLDLYLLEIEGSGKRKAKLIPLSEAAKRTPYSAEYLSLLARKGMLDAIKVGRVWMTTKKNIKRYVELHD